MFERDLPIVLELACGKGEYTTHLAVADPEKNYIGIDIKGARIWKGATMAHDQGLKNVAFLRTRIELIRSFLKRMKFQRYGSPFPIHSWGTRNPIGAWLLMPSWTDIQEFLYPVQSFISRQMIPPCTNSHSKSWKTGKIMRSSNIRMTSTRMRCLRRKRICWPSMSSNTWLRVRKLPISNLDTRDNPGSMYHLQVNFCHW